MSRNWSYGALTAIVVAVVVAIVISSGGGSAGASASAPACGDHASCPAPASGSTSSTTAAATATPSDSFPPSPCCSVLPKKLTVGLGYIPSVQFAPFYLADQKGYYREENLEVTFQNAIDADLVPKVGSGQVDIGLSDGTSVIPAVSQGVPIKYVATVYGKFPSIVFAKEASGIKSAADLKGKRVGIPGKYGSSWVMLQALLGSAGLTPADVTIVEFPDFGQGAALAQGAIDAATGFVNNEPVQLELSGTKATVLTIDQITPLPGPGLIAGTSTISAKREAVAGFIRATLKAMNEIAATPSVGLDAAIRAVPELGQARDAQSAVLAATIAAWAPPGATAGAPLTGAVDEPGWSKSIDYLKTLGLVPNPITTTDTIDTSFTSGS